MRIAALRGVAVPQKRTPKQQLAVSTASVCGGLHLTKYAARDLLDRVGVAVSDHEVESAIAQCKLDENRTYSVLTPSSSSFVGSEDDRGLALSLQSRLRSLLLHHTQLCTLSSCGYGLTGFAVSILILFCATRSLSLSVCVCVCVCVWSWCAE